MSSILVKSESRYPVNRKKIREKIEAFLEKKKITAPVEMAVVVVGDRKMRSLNKKYRDKEETTALLAFPLDDPRDRRFPSPFSTPDGVLRLGDIVISYPQALRMAVQEEKLVDEKLNELVEHGIKKLLGSG